MAFAIVFSNTCGASNRLEQNAHLSGRQLASFLDEAERAGVNTQDVLRSLGQDALCDRVVLAGSELSLIDFFRIEGEVARRLDDLTAHLSERKLTFDTGAFVTAQVDRSTTLFDALNNLARHFNMMHGEHYNTVRVTDRTVTLIINDDTFPYTMRDDAEMIHFIGDCVLIKVQCLLDSISEGLAAKALRRVSLKRSQMSELPGHLLFWGAPLSYGQTSYELSFDYDLAHTNMPKTGEIDLSSEGVFSRVIAYLEQAAPTVSEQSVKARTLDLIRGGVVSQDAIAHRLSISVATLRRRLEEEQTSFRQLVNAHRLSEATALLKKGHSVSQVTDLLNYSDIRAFNRAFKRWKGETPAKYAQRHAQAALNV